MRLDTYYTPTDKLIQLLANAKCTDVKISAKTFNRLKSGEKTTYSTAAKVTSCFDIKFSALFAPTDKQGVLPAKSIKQCHDLISSILATAVQWNVITSNPAERVKPPKIEKPKAQFYDEAQTTQLLMLLENEPLKFKTAVYLAIDTGLRIGELAGLT